MQSMICTVEYKLGGTDYQTMYNVHRLACNKHEEDVFTAVKLWANVS